MYVSLTWSVTHVLHVAVIWVASNVLYMYMYVHMVHVLV